MALRISSEISRQLKVWADEADPNECCGLIFGDESSVQNVELTRNMSASPATNFEIDPERLIAAEKLNRSGEKCLLGYFHSHPNGTAIPSQTDAAMATCDGRFWLIIAAGQITAWELSTDSKFLEQELVFE